MCEGGYRCDVLVSGALWGRRVEWLAVGCGWAEEGSGCCRSERVYWLHGEQQQLQAQVQCSQGVQ